MKSAHVLRGSGIFVENLAEDGSRSRFRTWIQSGPTTDFPIHARYQTLVVPYSKRIPTRTFSAPTDPEYKSSCEFAGLYKKRNTTTSI